MPCRYIAARRAHILRSGGWATGRSIAQVASARGASGPVPHGFRGSSVPESRMVFETLIVWS